jgi:MFS family permease
MLLALNGGDLLLKPAARHCYGQFGFRNVLIVSALVATATTLACALFHPGIGLSVILGVLLAAGMARSLLFTGITSLAFVDLDEHEIGAANVIVSISQQVTSAIAVSISALILRLAALFHGGGAPALTDFQAAFIAMAAIGFLGAGFLLRLSPTAGAGARESRSPR